MIVYNVGDKIKIKKTIATLGKSLEAGTAGIVVATHPGRVEAAFEGLGILSVDHDLIKKKTRKIEKLVKAKNLKLTDEIHLPGSGEYVKVANIYRDEYDSPESDITVESASYSSHTYGYTDMVEVRR